MVDVRTIAITGGMSAFHEFGQKIQEAIDDGYDIAKIHIQENGESTKYYAIMTS